jgi:hypothetical protein
MSRVAMLKRKLDELKQAEAKLQRDLTDTALEIRFYETEEMQHFIRVHCARVTGFRGSSTDVLVLTMDCLVIARIMAYVWLVRMCSLQRNCCRLWQ